jgi:hypothetical protein
MTVIDDIAKALREEGERAARAPAFAEQRQQLNDAMRAQHQRGPSRLKQLRITGDRPQSDDNTDMNAKLRSRFAEEDDQ